MRRWLAVLSTLALVVGGLVLMTTHAQAVSGAPGTFVSQSPIRVLDTRSGLGGSTLAPGATLPLAVLGNGGVPASGVSSVVLNLTETNSTAAGFITAFPGGTSLPTASNLNFVPGETNPNLVTVPVGSNGQIDLFNGSPGTIDLIADIQGYYVGGVAALAGSFVPVAPTRVLDTRIGLGGTTAGSDGTVPLRVLGKGGVPASGVGSVILNLTETNPAAPGHITAYPGGGSLPTASNLNFVAGQTRPNLVSVPVGSNGQINLNNGSSGTTDLVADVEGYTISGAAAAGGAFVPENPTRILDTRTGLAGQTLRAGTSVFLPILGNGGVPASGVAAVVVNVTETNAATPGHVTTYPYGQAIPNASNLNFVAGQTSANLVTVPVPSNGYIALQNDSGGNLDLIADVEGYVLSPPPPLPPPTAPAVSDDRTTANFMSAPGTPGATVAGFRYSNLSASTVSDGGGTWVAASGGRATSPLPSGSGQQHLYVVAVDQVGRTSTVTDHWYANAVPGWGAPTPVDVGPPDANAAAPPESQSGATVACLSATACVRVEGYDFVAFDGQKWSDPVPVLSGGDVFEAVACAGSAYCVATDSDGTARTYDGTSWSAPVPVTSSGAVDEILSCPFASYCMLVAVTDRGQTVQSYQFSGGSWSTGALFWPTGSQGAQYPSSLSCLSSTGCLAMVGSTGYIWNGSAWSATASARGAAVQASCMYAGHCVGVDSAGQTWVFNGSTWTAVGYPSGRAASSLECFPTTCFAVMSGFRSFDGTNWNLVAGQNGQAAGSTCVSGFCLILSAGNLPDQTYTSAGIATVGTFPDRGAPVAISCSSDAACRVADSTGNTFGSTGGPWSRQAFPLGPNGLTSYYTAADSGLSCASISSCVAVGSFAPTPSQAQFASTALNGSGWASPTSVAGEPASEGSSVACGTPTFCVGSGGGPDVRVWDGAAWGSPTTVFPSGGVSAISCLGNSFCMAVGGNSAAAYQNGTWQAPVAVTTYPPLVDVSCASSSSCVAIDGWAGAFAYDGKSWRQTGQLAPLPSYTGSPIQPNAVSCASTTLCVAIDSQHAYLWNGSQWSAPEVINGDGSGLIDVSCGTTRSCSVITPDGTVVTYTAP